MKKEFIEKKKKDRFQLDDTGQVREPPNRNRHTQYADPSPNCNTGNQDYGLKFTIHYGD